MVLRMEFCNKNELSSWTLAEKATMNLSPVYLFRRVTLINFFVSIGMHFGVT